MVLKPIANAMIPNPIANDIAGPMNPKTIVNAIVQNTIELNIHKICRKCCNLNNYGKDIT